MDITLQPTKEEDLDYQILAHVYRIILSWEKHMKETDSVATSLPRSSATEPVIGVSYVNQDTSNFNILVVPSQTMTKDATHKGLLR